MRLKSALWYDIKKIAYQMCFDVQKFQIKNKGCLVWNFSLKNILKKIVGCTRAKSSYSNKTTVASCNKMLVQSTQKSKLHVFKFQFQSLFSAKEAVK